MKLKIVLEPREEGGFTVYVPSLPGCTSEGDTREESLARGLVNRCVNVSSGNGEYPFCL